MRDLVKETRNAIDNKAKGNAGIVVNDAVMREVMYIADAIQSLIASSKLQKLDICVDEKDLSFYLEIDKLIVNPTERSLLVIADNAKSIDVKRVSGENSVQLRMRFKSPLMMGGA